MSPIPIPPQPKTTLWIWPTGLFPRRIIFYLRAKNLTLPILTAHNIHLIPVALTPSFQLLSLPAFEPRPQNTSLPIMRIESDDKKVLWIRESAAIIEYFEEVFGVEKGYRELRGETVQQRARTRDGVSLLNDVMVWSTVGMVHSNRATVSWSGLSEEGMSGSAAHHADGKVDALLKRLEGWIEEDGKGCRSLSGEGGDVTVLDVVVMSMEYIREVYGEDGLGGNEVLKGWWEKLRVAEWVVGKEELKKVEESGKWATVLAE
jgi:glutathione S-transferase